MTDRLSKLKRRQLDESARRFPRGAASPRSGWVRAMREALGMSQAQLATRAGISRATVQKLELAEGRRRITLDSLDRLAADSAVRSRLPWFHMAAHWKVCGSKRRTPKQKRC